MSIQEIAVRTHAAASAIPPELTERIRSLRRQAQRCEQDRDTEGRNAVTLAIVAEYQLHPDLYQQISDILRGPC